MLLYSVLYGTPHIYTGNAVRGWTPHGSAQKKGAHNGHHNRCTPRYRPQETVAAHNAFPSYNYNRMGGESQRIKRGAQRFCTVMRLFFITAERQEAGEMIEKT